MEEENLMSIFNSEGLEINIDSIPEIDDTELDLEGQEGAEAAEEGSEGEEEATPVAPDAPEGVGEFLDDDNTNAEDDSSEGVGEGEGEEEGDPEDVSPTLYSSFASVLSEQGLLPSLDLQEDSKIESAEDLAEAFKNEINNQVKEYLITKVGANGYEALEKGVSLAEYQQYENNVQTLDSITEDKLAEDVELSKKIIYQDYISQGLSDKRAAAILKKSIDLGDEQILEDAKASLESLKEVESKRLEQTALQREKDAELAKAQQEKIDNDLKNSIYNSKEFIPGMKLTKAMQDRVYNSITKVVGKSPNGVAENQLMRDRRDNPVEFDSKLYYLYELTKGFKDFSKVISKSESTATSRLEKELRRTKFQDNGKPTFLSDPESYGGVGSELVI